jgi:2,3-diketo-5-methylthio-1-phosphopentane phosphatase
MEAITRPAPEHKLRVFCDFDGTIVPVDVGDRFFEEFSGPQMWDDHALYTDGKIDASEMFARSCARIPVLGEKRIEEFCSRFEVDPAFPAFLDWCEEKGFPVAIVSDGLDLYIERILAPYSGRIDIISNQFVMNDRTREVKSPWSDSECRRCGTCKRNIITTRSSDDDIIVYVGDGFSDFCPVEYADVVFARDALIGHCQRNNISFRDFGSFADVKAVLDAMLAGKRIRKPHRAELRRRALWAGG